jgi:dihydrofolate reductase
MIRAILACDEEWGIGREGGLPWPNNSDDLKWFKETTMGSVVAMGRNTWDSLPNKPLPGRNNVVVTSRLDEDYDKGGYHCMKFENAAIELVNMNRLQNVWIIGGSQLFIGLIDILDEIWLSRISGKYNCDTFLPGTLIQEKFTLTDSGKRGNLYIDVWSRR